MNAKSIIAGIIILLCFAGVGAILFAQQNKNSNSSNSTNNKVETSTNVTESDKKIHGSLSDLLKQGDNYTCNFNYSDATGGKTQGKVYVLSKGAKVSGEFTNTQKNGQTIKTNMIFDGQYNHIWDPDKKEGFKMAISKEDQDKIFNTDGGGQTDKTTPNDVEFDCSKWDIDTKLFIAPTDVKFSEFNLNSVAPQEGSTQNTKIDCSVCNQVPEGTARNECLSALKCL